LNISRQMNKSFPQLIFPAHEFSIKTENQSRLIFDRFRKKWISLTPEEWVRQHLAEYLTGPCRIPPGLVVIEGALSYNNTRRRFDLLAYGRGGKPVLLAECKSFRVKISQQVFDQVSVYNLALGVPYLLVTNGKEMFVCKINFEEKSYSFLSGLPEFGLL